MQIVSFLVSGISKVVNFSLDEFDSLVSHPNFQDASFFAFLRSLNQERGLVIVIASRCDIAKLHSVKKEQIGSASPVNTMIDHRVKPLTKAINTMLDKAGDNFSDKDRDFIRRMAGRNPFLLQAMASALYEKENRPKCRRTLFS